MSFRALATVVPMLVAVMALASSPDSTVNLPPWTTPRTWDIQIATPYEPGPRFVVSGRLLGPDSMPMPGIEMYFYHADSMGLYARKGQKFNRIAGVLRTNKGGEYRVRSVLPGMYAGPGHVHFEIWKNGHPLRGNWMALYLAPGTPPVSSWKPTGTAEREFNPQMGLITLDSSGVYHCVRDLTWNDMLPLPASYDSIRSAERKQLEQRKR